MTTFTSNGEPITQPSPQYDIPIVCNNGVIKARMASGLPLGYTQVEYLQSSGTQYIDTGLPLNTAYKYRMVVASVNGNNASNIWGYKSNASYTGGKCCIVGWTDAGTTYIGAYSKDGNISGTFPTINDLKWTANTFFDIEMDVTNSKFIVNGTNYYSTSGVSTVLTTDSWTDTHNPYLFGVYQVDSGIASQALKCKAYQVYNQSGVLIQNLIPCKNSSNVVGMYDLVNDVFYQNAGTGTFTAGADDDDLIITTDGTQEVVTDSLGNTASAERLLEVGDYKDTQEVLNGAVTRQVGITILRGTENWSKSSTYTGSFYCSSYSPDSGTKIDGSTLSLFCTHFVPTSNLTAYNTAPIGSMYWSTPQTINLKYDDGTATVEQFKQFLADQYSAGTPVTIVYPTNSPTTETVTGQFLSKSPVTQTAGSISNLPIAITESQKTVPTPQQPLPINCNNGVLGIDGQGNITVTGTTETVEVTGKNLFDKDAIVNNYMYDSSGNYISSNNVCLTDWIKVESGTRYTITTLLAPGKLYGANRYVNYFDENQTWLSQNNYIFTEITSASVQFTTPANAKYIRLSWAIGSSLYAIDNNTVQLELGSTATTYESYYNGGTATAENLFKVGTYQDVQSVIDGGVTRNVGIKVLDGTEDWSSFNVTQGILFRVLIANSVSGNKSAIEVLCNAYQVVQTANRTNGTLSGSATNYDFINDNYTTLDTWKAYLTAQYNAGNPVVVVYPLATPTTETVTAQPMNIQEGTNIVQITQASMDDLELEVKYKAGVEVTITEIENAQLDDNVEVIING